VSPDTTTATSDRSALPAQRRQPRGEEVILVDVLVTAVVLGADEEVLEEDKEIAL